MKNEEKKNKTNKKAKQDECRKELRNEGITEILKETQNK